METFQGQSKNKSTNESYAECGKREIHKFHWKPSKVYQGVKPSMEASPSAGNGKSANSIGNLYKPITGTGSEAMLNAGNGKPTNSYRNL